MNAEYKYFIESIEKLAAIVPGLKESENYKNFINATHDEEGKLIEEINFLVWLGILTFQVSENVDIEVYEKLVVLDFYKLSIMPIYEVITEAKIIDGVLVIGE